jgi:hypothetical protein
MLDPTSPTWMWLEAHLHARVLAMREQNDAPLTDAETAALRGRIAFAKELIALPMQQRMEADEERRVRDTTQPSDWSHPEN